MRNGGALLTRPKACAGVTLPELGIALAVAGAIVAWAIQGSGALRLALQPIVDENMVQNRIDATQAAVEGWYRARYCGSRAQGPPLFPIDDDDAAAACAADDADCLSGHVASHLADLVSSTATTEGEFRWDVTSASRVPRPPPTLRQFWTPAPYYDDRIAGLAIALDAFCDDDGDAATAEPCDGVPVDERLVWMRPLGSSSPRDVSDRLRLRAWLAVTAVDCDADDDGTLDVFCDGTGVDRNGLVGDHIVDVDGDGCDDARPAPLGPAGDACRGRAGTLLDRNQDGLLDFDATGDLKVDGADFISLGC